MKIKILFLVCGTLLFSTPLFSEVTTKEITQKVDSLLAEATKMGLFSGHLLMSHNGEKIYYRQEGYADWNTKRKMDENTLFNIGSLNKQFTEEIIHQLVNEKKLEYSDPLSKHCKFFPDKIGNQITIQLLLDMKSGLGDYLRHPQFAELQKREFSLTELIDLIKTEPLLFEPGTHREYSNSGYAVLGAVIEKVTQLSFEKNIEERIVKPLGLKKLVYSKSEKSKELNRAFGTEIDFDGNKLSMDDISNSTPAGGIYTTLDNLFQFVEAKRKALLPSAKIYKSGSIAGGTPLWNSTINFDVESGYSFVVMANTGSIADELTFRINAILKNKRFPPLNYPIKNVLYNLLRSEGSEYVKLNATKLAEQAGLPFDERFFNYFGYQFIEAKKIEYAIQLFKINVELFPTIPNTYDSLAEAYMLSGDKKSALNFYKEELKLQPNNEQLKKRIGELEK